MTDHAGPRRDGTSVIPVFELSPANFVTFVTGGRRGLSYIEKWGPVRYDLDKESCKKSYFPYGTYH